MDLRSFVGIGLVVAMAVFVTAVTIHRGNRRLEPVKSQPAKAERNSLKPAPAPLVASDNLQDQAPREKIDPKKQGAGLHDATLLGLIQNAQVAHQMGDMKTRDALLTGLRKVPERSRELLEREIAKAKDRTVAYALQTLMQELQ